MSEELIQRNLVDSPEKMGDWNFYNIGATTLKALKSAKIIPDHDYDEYEKKKPDALIVKKPIVIAAIEYKTPQQLRTQKQIEKAIAQELGTARALNAKIYIITDGKKSIWVNPKTGNEITQEDGSKITLNFDKNSTDCINLINKITASITSDNDQIKAPSAVDPLPLAQKVWQDLWAVSGATPENCLYTFVEIFIFKYLSDLGVLQGVHSFYSLISQYGSNTDDDVLDFYAQTIRVKIKQLFPWNPKDKTTIINGTIFVSKDDKAVSGYATVFRRILNRFNDFGTLENIDYDFKSKLFETFLKESISKKNWGQYFTPLKVVRAIVNMVELSVGMKVCDPACGVGKFLLEPILHDLHKFFKVENGKLTPQISLSGFDKGFDKEEQKTIILAKANMLIYMSSMIKENPGITEQFSELFNKTFFLQTNTILGTLAQPIKEEYDLILTNPPYVMSGSSNLKEEIAKQDELKAHYAVSAMGIEGLFMEWIVRALKPNGKAFIVVPDGIMNRSNDKKLRNFILENCIIDAVISLPLNTFFTTNKKTYILALTKKEPISVNGTPTLEKQTTPVFTYLCSEIGETRDVYRFDIEQNDLETASDLFNMFKGAKSKFRSDDKRCKVVSIDEFYNGTHWSIDRWWTRAEKIDLGIEDSIEAITLEDYLGLLSDTATTIMEYDEPLRELIKKKSQITNSKEISLDDESLFELFIGKRLLRKDFVAHKGTIPAYSANVFEPFVYTNSSNISDFSKPYVLWGIDGDLDYNVMPIGTLFATTDHCGAIRIINPSISPYYLAYILEESKHLYGFDRGLRASLTNMKKVKVMIPIDANGDYDINAQESIAEALLALREVRNQVINRRNLLLNPKIVLQDNNYSYKYYPLKELFSTIKGFSKYTKKYGNEHTGKYPVYSASSHTPLTMIDTFDYDGKYMTWSTNGFAGTILILDGKFSINGDRGILVPIDGRTDLDFEYMKFTLEPIFRDMAKGRKGDNGEDEFTKLYPSMLDDVMVPVPVDKDGNIDLNAQKEIAAKYLAVEQCKKDIAEKLQALIDQKVNI
jgi:type I restriction-modification system DNA methylase subunit